MSYVAERVAGREHIPLYPKGFVAVRILQLVLGIICLGLSGFVTGNAPFSGAALTLFISIVTLLSSIYVLIAHFGPPAAYNYWAILGLDIFLVLFWLIAFALLASQAAIILAVGGGIYIDFTIIGSTAAAAAGLGAVNWVAYLVSLILHSIALHRHRKAGLHAMPGKSPDPAASLEGDKFQMQPQQPQTYYPPQPQTHEAPSTYPQQQQPLPQQTY
ncbi:hypothetical protein GGR58DRAFT_507098 [Xylaria digitata]|nr:hypothetical protein GGR58DRAFT_507098 [Xylaria digitata]